MAVRAKFRINSVEDFGGHSRQLKMGCVYETDAMKDADPENIRFTKATPSGSLTIQIDNPAAFEQFEIGDEWYADFTLAKRREPAS